MKEEKFEQKEELDDITLPLQNNYNPNINIDQQSPNLFYQGQQINAF
jgi:hypothetical protein